MTICIVFLGWSYVSQNNETTVWWRKTCCAEGEITFHVSEIKTYTSSFFDDLSFRLTPSLKILKQICSIVYYLMYRSIPKPPMPPRAHPRAFDFFEKFWSNSPLCCQFRRSNAPPVGALKRVKSPTLQAC